MNMNINFILNPLEVQSSRSPSTANNDTEVEEEDTIKEAYNKIYAASKILEIPDFKTFKKPAEFIEFSKRLHREWRDYIKARDSLLGNYKASSGFRKVLQDMKMRPRKESRAHSKRLTRLLYNVAASTNATKQRLNTK
jgi:hypothetical protein